MGKLLDKFRERFCADVMGSGGCETCGYGADDGMSEAAFDKLLAEIDTWATETFGSANEVAK